MIYYEQLALGKWGARVTYLNRPVPGPFVRAVKDVEPAHMDLSLRELWSLYSPDSPRNRPEGSATVDSPKTPDPKPDAAAAERLPDTGSSPDSTVAVVASEHGWAEEPIPSADKDFQYP